MTLSTALESVLLILARGSKRFPFFSQHSSIQLADTAPPKPLRLRGSAPSMDQGTITRRAIGNRLGTPYGAQYIQYSEDELLKPFATTL